MHAGSATSKRRRLARLRRIGSPLPFLLSALATGAAAAEYQWTGPAGQSALVVRTDRLIARVEPQAGGRLTSLKWVPSGRELLAGYGLGGDLSVPGVQPGLLWEPYSARVVRRDGQVAVELAALTTRFRRFRHRVVAKRYLFADGVPAVGVTVAVHNRTRFGGCFGLRASNTVRGTGGDEAVFFGGGPAGLRQVSLVGDQKLDRRVPATDLGGDWFGWRDGRTGQALVMAADCRRLLGLHLVREPGQPEALRLEACFKARAVPEYGQALFSYDVVVLERSTDAADAIRQAQGIRAAMSHSPFDPAEAIGLLRLAPPDEPIQKTRPWFFLAGFEGDDRPSYRVYGVARALEHLPGGAWVFVADCGAPDSDWERPELCRWFPATLEEMKRYEAAVLVDVPGWAIGEDQEHLLEAYLQAGGHLILVGDQATGWSGRSLARWFPAEIGPEPALSAAPATIGWPAPPHPIVRGLPQTDRPNTYFHRVKAHPEAQVIATAGGHPILLVRRVGRGQVIGWTATPVPRMSQGADPPPEDLTQWDFYEELWQQIGQWCVRQGAEGLVRFNRFTAPARVQTAGPPASCTIEYEIENRSADPVQVVLSVVSSTQAQELPVGPRQEDIRPGQTHTSRLQVPLPERDQIEYLVDVRSTRDVLLARRDGRIEVRPTTWLSLEIKGARCLRPGENLEAACAINGPAIGGSAVEADIVDFRDQVVERLAPAAVAPGQRVAGASLVWTVPDLAPGEYRLRVRLTAGQRPLDAIEEAFRVAALMPRPAFPILAEDVLPVEPRLATERVRYYLGQGVHGMRWRVLASAPATQRSGRAAKQTLERLGGISDPGAEAVVVESSAGIAAQAQGLEGTLGTSPTGREVWLGATVHYFADSPPFPEVMATQAYTALAHGAHGLVWWVADDNRFDAERVAAFAQANRELARLGPLFVKLRRAADRPQPVTLDPCVDTALFEDPGRSARYLVAVNRKPAARAVDLLVPVAQAPAVARDLLTGEDIPLTTQAGRVGLRLELKAGWGRAVVLLPAKPTHLRVAAEAASPGSVLEIQAQIDADAPLPIELSVTDAEGLVRHEHGAVEAMVGGLWRRPIRLARNDPAGTWHLAVRVPSCRLRQDLVVTVLPRP